MVEEPAGTVSGFYSSLQGMQEGITGSNSSTQLTLRWEVECAGIFSALAGFVLQLVDNALQNIQTSCKGSVATVLDVIETTSDLVWHKRNVYKLLLCSTQLLCRSLVTRAVLLKGEKMMSLTWYQLVGWLRRA